MNPLATPVTLFRLKRGSMLISARYVIRVARGSNIRVVRVACGPTLPAPSEIAQTPGSCVEALGSSASGPNIHATYQILLDYFTRSVAFSVHCSNACHFALGVVGTWLQLNTGTCALCPNVCVICKRTARPNGVLGRDQC